MIYLAKGDDYMNRDEAFALMVETIKKNGNCLVITEEEDYAILPATEFVGGEEGYYMCSELGNVMYDVVEEICNDLLDFIKADIIDIDAE